MRGSRLELLSFPPPFLDVDVPISHFVLVYISWRELRSNDTTLALARRDSVARCAGTLLACFSTTQITQYRYYKSTFNESGRQPHLGVPKPRVDVFETFTRRDPRATAHGRRQPDQRTLWNWRGLEPSKVPTHRGRFDRGSVIRVINHPRTSSNRWPRDGGLFDPAPERGTLYVLLELETARIEPSKFRGRRPPPSSGVRRPGTSSDPGSERPGDRRLLPNPSCRRSLVVLPDSTLQPPESFQTQPKSLYPREFAPYVGTQEEGCDERRSVNLTPI